MSSAVPSPIEIATALGKSVIGQGEAVKEMAIALSKKLSGLRVGNILMIGGSGSGKTTLMRAVESFLASDPALEARSTVVRVHANILAEEVASGHRGQALLTRLLERARQQLGPEAGHEAIIERATRGLVLVDEIDKIRSRVGDRVNTDGIRAQEAMLTLIESETVPCTLPDWAESITVDIDTRGLLFVGGGAFEGLYDAVYDRVTVGADRGAFRNVTVLEGSSVREENQFALRDWLRNQDLFDYGMTPQFLSRFDAIVLLNDLKLETLVRIFLESNDSGYRQALEYFASRDIEFAMSPAAVHRVAKEAAAQPRIGARALKEVFRRVIRDYEYDPSLIGGSHARRTLMIDLPEVETALSGTPGRGA